MKEVIVFYSKIIIFILLPVLAFVALGAVPIKIFVASAIWQFVLSFAYAVISAPLVQWYICYLFDKNIF